jgi:hypothetical protein
MLSPLTHDSSVNLLCTRNSRQSARGRANCSHQSSTRRRRCGRVYTFVQLCTSILNVTTAGDSDDDDDDDGNDEGKAGNSDADTDAWAEVRTRLYAALLKPSADTMDANACAMLFGIIGEGVSIAYELAIAAAGLLSLLVTRVGVCGHCRDSRCFF